MRLHSGMQFLRSSTVVGICLAWATAAVGQIAFDGADPSDPAYADGWSNGDNGGFGFGPWSGIGEFMFMHEIDPDSSYPNNDLETSAFAFGAETYQATRPFANPMQAGQSFKMDFDQFPYDPAAEIPDGGYTSQDSFLSFSSAGGGRLALYNWLGKYNPPEPPNGPGGPTTLLNEHNNDGVSAFADWGIYADSVVDNLNGGAPLLASPDAAGLLLTGYSGPDSTDGFSLTLELVTIDTFRLLIVDDGVTKVDVSGQLTSANGQVDLTGHGIQSVSLWFTPGSFSEGFPTAYFTNLEITGAEAPDADYNGDGIVDAADYVAWRKIPGAFGGDPGGYDAWRENFGEGGDGGGLSSTGVPEPSSVILLLCGLAAVALRRNPC